MDIPASAGSAEGKRAWCSERLWLCARDFAL